MLRGSNYALVLSSLGIKRFAVILREANIILQPSDSSFKKIRDIILLNFTYRFADAIICNCKHASFSLKRLLFFFNKPIATLANPVFENYILTDEFLKNIHEKRKRNKILCVSRHNQQKDIAILLMAFRILFEKRSKISLTVVGSGPLLEKNIKLADKLGVADKVVFIERLHPLNNLYLEHDTFVLPSQWEGTPNAMVEALAFGMKVVSFKSLGCAPSLVNLGNGKLVHKRKPEDLAAALDSSLKENFPDQYERCKSLEKFEFSNSAMNFIKFYRKIL